MISYRAVTLTRALSARGRRVAETQLQSSRARSVRKHLVRFAWGPQALLLEEPRSPVRLSEPGCAAPFYVSLRSTKFGLLGYVSRCPRAFLVASLKKCERSEQADNKLDKTARTLGKAYNYGFAVCATRVRLAHDRSSKLRFIFKKSQKRVSASRPKTHDDAKSDRDDHHNKKLFFKKLHLTSPAAMPWALGIAPCRAGAPRHTWNPEPRQHSLITKCLHDTRCALVCLSGPGHILGSSDGRAHLAQRASWSKQAHAQLPIRLLSQQDCNTA